LKGTGRELGHLRKLLVESRLAEYDGVGQDFVDRNPTPSTVAQPPSFQAGKSNSVVAESAELDFSLAPQRRVLSRVLTL
jgi:hypothetical protein